MTRRIATWSDPKLANRVAQELLPLLLAARRHGEALRIVKARLQADVEFRPLTSEHLIQLATLARVLFQDFDRHYPDDAARNSARQLVEQVTR